MSNIQKSVISGRPEGYLNYSPEFKQRLIEASFQSDVSISRLALDNGINANLLFKWHQKWQQGKIKLPPESDGMPKIIPVTLDDEPTFSPAPAVELETLNASFEVTFRHGILRLNGAVSKNLLPGMRWRYGIPQ